MPSSEHRRSSKSLAAVILAGLAIAGAAGWSSFAYGDWLKALLAVREVAFGLAFLLLLGFLAIVLRAALRFAHRRRRPPVEPRAFGPLDFAWMGFSFACLAALLALTSAALIALPFGYAGPLFEAFLQVLVCYALVSLAGHVVLSWREVFRLLAKQRLRE